MKRVPQGTAGRRRLIRGGVCGVVAALVRMGSSAGSMAVVIGLLTVACASSTQNSTPSPTPTVPPPSTTMPPDVHDHGPVRNGQLRPGTYTDYNVDGAGFNVRFTVPAGWTWNGRYLSKGGAGLPDGAAIFFFGGRVEVYADPCHWAGVQSNPPTRTTVRALVTALAAQPMRRATTPTYRSPNAVGVGYRWAGMAVRLTVPDDINFPDCDRGEFRSWGSGPQARSHQGPGQRDLVWAEDLTGYGVDSRAAPVIIDAASFPSTPDNVIFEIDSILRSIVAGDWG